MIVQYVIAYLIRGGGHNKYVPRIKRFMQKLKARKIQQSVYVLDYMPSKRQLKKIVKFFEDLKKEKDIKYTLLRRIPDRKLLETELAKMVEKVEVAKSFIVVAYDIPSTRKNRKSAVYEFIRYRMLSLAGAKIDYSVWIFPDDSSIRNELRKILSNLVEKYGARVMVVDALLPHDTSAYAEIIDLIITTKEDMYKELSEKFRKLLEKKIINDEGKRKLLRNISVMSSKVLALYCGIMQVEQVLGVNVDALKEKVKKLYDDVEVVKRQLLMS